MLPLIGGCTSAEFNKGLNDVLDAVNSTGSPTNSEIGLGLKEALTNGITKGVAVVSKQDGYLKNPQIKIPFPPSVKKVENTLRNVGMGNMVDEMVVKLNRAAEDAATEAKPIFVSAIKQLTFQDVMNILQGQDNAATEFLRRTTSDQLRGKFKPKINTSLNKVKALNHWTDVSTAYNKLPLTQKVETDLPEYVTGQALNGLFHMVAKEEKAIRKDPIKRTSDLLKRVFALQDK